MTPTTAITIRQQTIHARICREITLGYTLDAIARRLGVEPVVVSQVATARKSAIALRQRGYPPKVIYANYRDLVTRDVCGL